MGNLVTLAYWDDLWLNESLATFLESKIVGRFQPDWREVQNRVQRRQRRDVCRQRSRPAKSVSRSNRAMTSSMPLTASRMPRADRCWKCSRAGSVKRNSPLVCLVTCASTPQKWHGGGSDLCLDQRAFRQRGAEQNPAEAEAQKQKSASLQSAITSFLDQPGLPLVSVSLTCSGKTPSLALHSPVICRWERQVMRRKCTKFRSVCATARRAKRNRRCASCSTENRQNGIFPPRAVGYVVANTDALGYYRVQYANTLAKSIRIAGLGNPKQSILSEVERIAFLGDQTALMRIGKVSAEELLNLAALAAKDETGMCWEWRRACFLASRCSFPMRCVRSTKNGSSRRLGRGKNNSALWPKPQDDDNTKMMRGTLARLVGGEGADKGRCGQKRPTQKWLASRSSVDAETIRLAIGIAAEHGDAALFDSLYQAAKAEPDRNQRSLLLNTGRIPQSAALAKRTRRFSKGTLR